jgi:hypothetical protein
MKEMLIPPAAQRDDDSYEMLRAWVAEKGLHCSIKVGMYRNATNFKEEDAWGILLADITRHIADAMNKKFKCNEDETINKVVKSMISELKFPTSEAFGDFLKDKS